jgi:hypothetical protein
MKVPLWRIAHARSGDKGDAVNCGVIAYRQEWYPLLRDYLTAERVKEHFAGICLGEVERYELPNLWALNFVLHNTLGGRRDGLAQARFPGQDHCLGNAAVGVGGA